MFFIKDGLDEKIAKLTEKRDSLLEEKKEREKREERRIRIMNGRGMALAETGRGGLFYMHLDEEYQDTIYMENPYVVETNAEMCFSKSAEEIHRDACIRYHARCCRKAFQYVVHCEAVLPGKESRLIIADPYKRVTVIIPPEKEIPELESLCDKMLVMKLVYYPFHDKYRFVSIEKILDEPYRTGKGQ